MAELRYNFVWLVDTARSLMPKFDPQDGPANGLGEDMPKLYSDRDRYGRTPALPLVEAVNAGISVELQRGARHHAEGGFWGDLMIPVVMRKG